MRKSALSSMSEIERYYNSKVRKSPHVVAHYAAGARLIGLTEKQMAKRLATLSVSGGENNDSPYAQPVWTDFTSNIPSKVIGPHKGKGKIRLMIIKKKSEDKDEGSEENSGHKTPRELVRGIKVIHAPIEIIRMIKLVQKTQRHTVTILIQAVLKN